MHAVAFVFAISVLLVILYQESAHAAPRSQGGPDQKVIVSTTAVGYDQTIRITLEGFPRDLALPEGSITFAGIRVLIPGDSGIPGSDPVSGKSGVISFTTTLPADADLGLSQLIVEVPPYFRRRPA